MNPPAISVYSYPGIFDKYKYSVAGDYGYKNNKSTVYYKNIVVTLWGIGSSDNGSVKVYFDPIYPNVTLEF